MNTKICFIYRKILTFSQLGVIMLLSFVKINKNHDKYRFFRKLKLSKSLFFLGLIVTYDVLKKERIGSEFFKANSLIVTYDVFKNLL